jgi:hypothetical protein
MRPLFADGCNSMFHVVFGSLAFQHRIIIPLFLLYQFVLKPDSNSWVDTAEFAIGYLLTLVMLYNSRRG